MNFLRTGSHKFKPWYKKDRFLMAKFTLINTFLVEPEKYDFRHKMEKIEAAKVRNKRLPQKESAAAECQYKLF